MQEFLTITFEAITLLFLAIMAADFIRNFPEIPSHPRIEVPSLLDDSPEVTNTVPEPLQQPLSEDLEAMTIRQLKQVARERKVRGYGDMRKAELIEALS